MEAKIRHAADGRVLVSVVFTRESPDQDEPMLEAVFRLFWPTDYTLDTNPLVLDLLTVTRMDTNEPVTLLESERPEVFNAVAVAAANFDAKLVQPGN